MRAPHSERPRRPVLPLRALDIAVIGTCLWVQRSEVTEAVEHRLQRRPGLPVTKSVVGHASLAPPVDQACGPQQAQGVADRIFAGVQCQGEIADAHLAGDAQRREDSNPQRVDEKAERRTDQLRLATRDTTGASRVDPVRVDRMPVLAHARSFIRTVVRINDRKHPSADLKELQ